MKDGTALIAPFGGALVRFFIGGVKLSFAEEQKLRNLIEEYNVISKVLLTAPTLKYKIALYEMLEEVKSDLSVFSYEYNAKPLIKKILERGIYYDKY